ncbi:hypothetical protein RHMOL_Rhmol06G0190200 [Rhododendron molle]|uniref:Uncharacterized protein n=1 Tax=Rhododendron molle TaxID=49168 RepID=A0ACC0NE02_RHOML|nr:hypothetical protein RHMOL_Rhmol06G0190200 [Rhododendron molle]
MAGNIRILDDEGELDAEEDERKPINGDPVVKDDEDEEDGIMAFSSAFLFCFSHCILFFVLSIQLVHCTCSPFIHGVEVVVRGGLHRQNKFSQSLSLNHDITDFSRSEASVIC